MDLTGPLKTEEEVVEVEDLQLLLAQLPVAVVALAVERKLTRAARAEQERVALMARREKPIKDMEEVTARL